MDWQDALAILSFIIGIISLIIGGISLYFSYVSMQRTGKIQDALKEQSEQLARKRKALELLPQIKELSPNVRDHRNQFDQVIQYFVDASGILSELRCSIDSSNNPTDKLVDMINTDFSAMQRSETPTYTILDYCQILGEIKIFLEKEAY